MWKIEYDNDDSGSFSEWWNISDGKMSFRSTTKEGAEFFTGCA